MLLVMNGLDCYLSDVPEGSDMEKKLMDTNTRKAAFVSTFNSLLFSTSTNIYKRAHQVENGVAIQV